MKDQSMLTAPVGRTLFWKTLPQFFALFTGISYNLVDMYFVAKIGTKELAAISFTFPIAMIVMNLIFGIATATSALTSQAIGRDEPVKAKAFAEKGLEITILFSFFVTIIGLLTLKPLFTVLGVDKDLMPLVSQYMTTWYLGLICINLPVIGGSIFRAKGNTFFPSIIMMSGALLNCILDPLLIFGWGPFPKMGIQGAAITTVFGNFVSLLFLFYKLKKDEGISIRWIPKTLDKEIWKQILTIAVPSSIANSLTPFATAMTNRMLIVFGQAAVAANSIASRVETIPFIAIFSLGSVLISFIGQNWGAKNIPRIKEAVQKSFIFSYGLGIFTAFILILNRANIAAFFDDDPQVIEVTSSYFSLIPYTYGILGTVFLTSYVMNAINKPYAGNFLSIMRLIVIYLPLAYLLQHLNGPVGIFQSRLIANIITGLLSSLLIWRVLFRKKGLSYIQET